MVKFTNVMKINGYEYDEFYPDKFDKLDALYETECSKLTDTKEYLELQYLI